MHKPRARLMRIEIDGKVLSFKRGTPPETSPSHIEAWKCPECFKTTRRSRCLVTKIQFGFEWDYHTDYFRCKCGCTYYAFYHVWLTQEGAING